MTDMQKRDELARQFANSFERKTELLPADVANPGLYFGYMAGYEAGEEGKDEREAELLIHIEKLEAKELDQKCRIRDLQDEKSALIVELLDWKTKCFPSIAQTGTGEAIRIKSVLQPYKDKIALLESCLKIAMDALKAIGKPSLQDRMASRSEPENVILMRVATEALEQITAKMEQANGK